MRPPEFTGGNIAVAFAGVALVWLASMRPPEFTGGNIVAGELGGVRNRGFNEAAGIHRRKHTCESRMSSRVERGFNEAAGIHRRKPPASANGTAPRPPGFNEAAGIHRRKRLGIGDHLAFKLAAASMRPPEFTGGNWPSSAIRTRWRHGCFNEAAGIHRRKPTDDAARAIRRYTGLQ